MYKLFYVIMYSKYKLYFYIVLKINYVCVLLLGAVNDSLKLATGKITRDQKIVKLISIEIKINLDVNRYS